MAAALKHSPGVQFWCSLVGRRFPRLQQLKSARIKELIVAQRNQAGCELPKRNPTYPKSKQQFVQQLVYLGNASGQQDVAGAEKPRKQVGLTTVSVPVGTTRPIQRENPDWQWCGHPFAGQHNWRPSGKHCSRFDAARHGNQVRIPACHQGSLLSMSSAGILTRILCGCSGSYRMWNMYQSFQGRMISTMIWILNPSETGWMAA